MADKKKILVTDDEADLRGVLSMRLSEAGYEIIEADNGKDALRIAKEQTPDLLILDIMMPGMDGMSMSQQLKEDAATKDIPIIFLTGLQDKKTQSTDYNSGANIIFAKPYEAKELLATVKNLIG